MGARTLVLPDDVDIDLLLVGTHRKAHHADSEDIAFGIYAIAGNGSVSVPRETPAALTPQPGWIAAHPSGRYLYAVNEVKEHAGVSAFGVSADGSYLRPLGGQPTPSMPCHCAVDATGRYLLVATFGGGSIHMFPILEDGGIGPEIDRHEHKGSSVHPRRQTHPHAHEVSIDPANRFVLVPDLGTDRVVAYEIDHHSGRLIPHPENDVVLPPASGPRHIAFDRRGAFAYLINEMSATISVFAYDAETGRLSPLQTVDLLPATFSGLRSGGEIGVHPSGRFLYATTRSHGSSGMPEAPGLDRIAWFGIDPATGLLTEGGRRSSGGGIPRSFVFDPSGRHLLIGHQCSGTIIVFRIDQDTGHPYPLDNVIRAPVPVCLFVPPPRSRERITPEALSGQGNRP